MAGLGTFIYYPFLSLYALSLGATPTEVGLISLIQGLFSAVLQAPIGYLGDRSGLRRPIVIGGFIASFGPFLQSFAISWPQLIPGMILSALLQVLWPMRQAVVAEEVRPEERISAFAAFFTIVMLPSAVMPLVAGYVMDINGLDSGMRLCLVTAGVLQLSASVLRLRFLREGKRVSAQVSREEDPRGVGEVISKMFEPIIKFRALQILFIGSCGVMFIFGVMNSFASVYAIKVIGVSNTEWGLISAASGLISVVMRIPISRLTIRLGERSALLASQFGRCLYPFAFVYAQNTYHLMALTTMNQFAFNLGSPAFQAMITELTPPSMWGRSYAVFGMVWGTMSSLATTAGGVVWDAWSPSSSLILSSVVGLVGTGFLMIFLKERNTNPTEK